jgi:PAS domain S-box-containing protein
MQTLSGFIVENAIYEGMSTRIYRAVREQDQRPVILKLLKADYPSPRELARLRHEYEMARSLDLPGVIRAYDLLPSGAGLALVLEDFGGQSLATMLEQPLAVARVLQIAITLAESLAEIHHRQIIHKDLKPANIIIDPDTDIVKITDFGIASRLARESSGVLTMGTLEGTLAYIAPEQTGRMNRAIDYRADFYALGVTLYELLTGQRPFKSEDVLELIHAHLARTPVPPHQLNPAIPPQLSAIVLKLMAKTAEERYQSAYGLVVDLHECQRQYAETGTIELFPLGRHDRPERFQPPQRLYGREREQYVLLSAFERASGGSAELVLLAGGAGVGKSALVQELYKPITARRGYFAAGKFDQLRRNVPYSAFIQALSMLLRQLLAEDDQRLAQWRERLQQALGSNGQLIADLLPDLTLIIGPQPPAMPLSPLEAQNRFNLTFRSFIKVFTQPDHPLVLALDDLQWADDASLQLLQTLLSGGASSLLVVGAYRDNEVTAQHPLNDVLAAIEAAGVAPTRLTLQPLDQAQLQELTADALRRKLIETAELAALLLDRTGGNPFFVNELLIALANDGLLRPQGEHWVWDIAQIERRAATDNVLALMTERIGRLPTRTQRLLSLGAALGGQFELQALAELQIQGWQIEQSEVVEALWPAIEQGLLIGSEEEIALASRDLLAAELANGTRIVLRFLHDRVQQAAYELLHESERPTVHLGIGRSLLHTAREHTPDLPIPFGSIDQLNQGRQLINDATEQRQLIELNLDAGRRAHAALAYQAARGYLTIAHELLPADSWQHDYDLTYTINISLAETEYLCRNFEQAEQRFASTLAAARSPLEQAQIYSMRVVLTSNVGNFAGAIPIAMEGLRLLGVELPAEVTQADVGAEIGAEYAGRAGRSLEALLAMPAMSDPFELAKMNLMLGLLPCAFLTGQNSLWALTVLKMVNRSYTHGHSPLVAVAYASYGIILVTSLGDYDSAELMGDLASALTEPLQIPALDSKIFFVRGTFLQHWRSHLRDCLPLLQRGRQTSLDAGDFFYAAYSQVTILNTLSVHGVELDQIVFEAQRAREFGRQLALRDVIANSEIVLQWAKVMRGQTPSLARLDDEQFDTASFMATILEQHLLIPFGYTSIYRMMMPWMVQNYELALEQANETASAAVILFGTLGQTERAFYQALILAARAGELEGEERSTMLAEAVAIQEKFALWAKNNPASYGPRHALINAEIAKTSGDDLAAMGFYDSAIDQALAGGFVQLTAMAAERAGLFYLSRNLLRSARTYLSEARAAYVRWGATGQVRRIEAQHGNLVLFNTTNRAGDGERTMTLGGITRTTTSTSSGTDVKQLDLNSVLKAAEQISGEIVLERLLERILRIAFENAGAERGALIVNDNGRLLIEAIGAAADEQLTLLQGMPIAESDQLGSAIVSYAARTGEYVVLNDAAHEGLFTNDPYVLQRKPRSVLCAPLVNQGRLAALVYLENNLTAGAFTPDRLATLNLLTGQAAIAIENARLYTSIEASERRYRTLFEESRDTIFITSLNGVIEAMNPAGLALFGYTAEEMRHLRAEQLYADVTDRQRLVNKLISEGQVRDFATVALRKDGAHIETLITASERRDRDGKVLGFQGIIRDVTEQRRAEQERLRFSALERELTLARGIQERLLPASSPNWPGIDLCCAGVPAREVGGDLYAYYQLDSVEQQRYAVAVGDVTGKGMPAALLMAVSLASLSSTVTQGLAPAQLLARLDKALLDYTAGSRQNCALVYLEIEQGSTTTLRAANAGGISPLLRRANGALEWLDLGGPPLGVGWGIRLGYQELQVELAPGEMVVLVSDGVVEANNSAEEMYGFERVEAALAEAPTDSAEAVLKHLQASVAAFVGTSEPHDDMTLVVLRV